MHYYTSCICSTFLHCVFSNDSSNRLFGKMHSHTGCICSTFLHYCVFKWALKSHIWEDASHTGCIHWIRIHSLHCHTGCFCFTFSYYCRVLEICWGKKPKKIVQSINHLFQWNRVHVVLNLDDDIIFVQLTQCAHRGCNIVTDTFRRKKIRLTSPLRSSTGELLVTSEAQYSNALQELEMSK